MKSFAHIRWSCGIAVLAVLSTFTTAAVAQDAKGGKDAYRFRVKAEQAGDLTVKASGEVRVELKKTLKDRHGDVYRVSLAFADRDDFDRAWPEIETLDLERVEKFLIRPSTGRTQAFKRGQDKSAASFEQILARAESAVCGDTVLRGLTTLPSGVELGINLHAAASRIKPHRISLGKNTLPGSCNLDVFDDCDFWAAGGCGGPKCVNICRFGGESKTIEAQCVEEEVFGFNTCACV